MQHFSAKRFPPHILSAGVVFVVLAVALGYQYWQVSKLTKHVELLTTELATTNTSLAQNVTELKNQTTGLSHTLNSTQQNIDAVKNQVGGVEQTVGSISGTVGNLQKLSQVDSELLRKYSKVFFMSENYLPARLTVLPEQYVYSTTRQEQFITEAMPYLHNLFASAQANGVTLYVKSGYRPFAEQKSLKSTYSTIYGAGTANSFSADQGYSEHQLGTTLDFITTGLDGKLEGFDNTQAFQWLSANAHNFGFVLSYPKGNSYYIYEPWHWRFVGVKLATYLHSNNLTFYDLDQREIDTYLVNIFD